jgi:tRNA(Ile)-lysidine synthase
MNFVGKSSWFMTASRRRRYLVGVSGGADSVALLHLLVDAGFSNLIVCHLNHGLRGRPAVEDAKFVKRLADGLGVKCEIGQADVKSLMAERSESVETAARFARHEFFANCATAFKCKRVVLAHHADDQAETVLWNLLRGSHGFKGMRELQTIITGSGVMLEMIRPFLGARRAELIGWLNQQGLRWREDASNALPIAVRNRLRNEALPMLSEISGRDAAFAFARGAMNARQQEELESWALEQAKVLDPQGRLHLPVLRTLPVALQRVALRDFLQTHGVISASQTLIERALDLLDVKNPAAVNLPGGGALRRQSARIFYQEPI